MINFYKPNSKNTGCAFGFRMGTQGKNQEPCIYMTAVKQFSWDANKKNGSFSGNHKDPEKSISVKFNEVEIGGFISAVENYKKFSAYHTFDDNSTSIMFSPYKKKNGDEAFSFTVTRNSSNKFGIGLEMSEAYLISEFFKYVLSQLFSFRINQQAK
ncbi:MAG: hypothetical protein HWN81_05865 [Candidatus Lokiarchaeota archaeon]|nr:hypothetical protein [Candidatus Lokiarchaeota archaeon]